MGYIARKLIHFHRYTFGETLYRWRASDLLIGIYYMCKKEQKEHPCSDIAQHGKPYGHGMSPATKPAAVEQLKEIDRAFRYCLGLRERRPLVQRSYFREKLDIQDEDLLQQELRANILKPSYLVTRDRELGAIVLAIRGTHSFRDAFTSLTGASKPHHVFDSNGVVLGYSHFGMLAAARWLKTQLKDTLAQALVDNPGYRLKIIGHSLGGGTAAMLTMMLRETGGLFSDTTCTAIACPACMTLELAKSCSSYVTTVINGADVIPTVSPGSGDKLRVEMMGSSWFREFQSDVRSSAVVRAVENGIKGVGSATVSATSWTTSKLSACYQRRTPQKQLKRRNSDQDLRQLEVDEVEAKGISTAREALPLSTSAPVSSPFSESASLSVYTQQQQEQQPAGEWTKRVVGWTQQVTSMTGKGITETSKVAVAAVQSSGQQAVQAVQSTGSILSRMWSKTSMASSVAAQQPDVEEAPPPVEQEYKEEEAMEIDLVQEAGRSVRFNFDDNDEMDHGDAEYDEDEDLNDAFLGTPPSGGRTRKLRARHLRGGSLEAELDFRMAEIAAAVTAAEEEEERTHAGHDTVPAVLPVGGYVGGQPSDGATGEGKKNDAAWKRMMYPAGRIMHLVPARLVPGYAENDSTDDDDQHEKDGKPEITASVWQMQKSLKRIEDLDGPEINGDDQAGPSSPVPPDAGNKKDDTPVPLPPVEPMILLDGIPQEAYGRIKLCRNVIHDHVIPNYVRSLDSAIERMDFSGNPHYNI